MTTELIPVIGSAEALAVRQLKEWTEIVTSWETRNRYEITDAAGNRLTAGELGGGVAGVFGRGLLASRRPFVIEVRDAAEAVVLRIRRPWTWIFAKVQVHDRNGQHLGGIQQRFALFQRRFELLTPAGQPFAVLEGPLFRPWTFHILRDGREVGAISKKWSGLLKEMFTDADNFGLTFAAALEPAERAVCLAATFLVDFLYFESSN